MPKGKKSFAEPTYFPGRRTSLLPWDIEVVGKDFEAHLEGRAPVGVGACHGSRQVEQLEVLGEGAGIPPKGHAQDKSEGEQLRLDGGHAHLEEFWGEMAMGLGFSLEAGALAEPRAQAEVDHSRPDVEAVGTRFQDHVVRLEVVVGVARMVDLLELQRQVMDPPQDDADGGRVHEHGLQGFPRAEFHQESRVVTAQGQNSGRPSEAVQI